MTTLILYAIPAVPFAAFMCWGYGRFKPLLFIYSAVFWLPLAVWFIFNRSAK